MTIVSSVSAINEARSSSLLIFGVGFQANALPERHESIVAPSSFWFNDHFNLGYWDMGDNHWRKQVTLKSKPYGKNSTRFPKRWQFRENYSFKRHDRHRRKALQKKLQKYYIIMTLQKIDPVLRGEHRRPVRKHTLTPRVKLLIDTLFMIKCACFQSRPSCINSSFPCYFYIYLTKYYNQFIPMFPFFSFSISIYDQ